MRLDCFLYGSIDICVSSIYLYGSTDICGSSIYVHAFRFLFAWFCLFCSVLILNERVLLYLCAILKILKILSVTERHSWPTLIQVFMVKLEVVSHS